MIRRTHLSIALAVLAAVILVACGPQSSRPASEQQAQQTSAQSDSNNQPSRNRPPPPPEPPGFQRIQVTSTVDGTEQDAILVVPERAMSEPRSLVVYLHGWSVTHESRRPDVEAEAEQRGWLMLVPNFRGPYVNHCGSQAAQQDILDGVSWVKDRYAVGDDRVYLVGFSGGGFVSMIMAHRYPDVWAAVSSWSGISDLAAWYTNEHADDRYGATMDTCFGGPPGESASIAEAYRERSPVSHFSPAIDLPPMDLNAQKDDPIVAVQHSLRAFQAIAPDQITDDEIDSLKVGESFPNENRLEIDPVTGRKIYLLRQSENARLTIREGRHEMLAEAAFHWFDQVANN